MKESIVYYTKNITSKNIVEIFKKMNIEFNGKNAIKVHSGEKGNQNFLRPEFYKDIVEFLNATVVECNTAYEGQRNTTSAHIKLLGEHGWSNLYNIDLLDEEEEISLPVKNGFHLKENFVGKNIEKYDNSLILSHFKGHPMGGYGGALKQLSIGMASSYGKAYIHGAGEVSKIWTADHDKFLESMADASLSVVNYFKGNIVYINVMKNMSVDCDCCAKAEDPCINDIGVLISLDPVAIDKACIDLVYGSNDYGKAHFIERVESRNGTHTIESAWKLGVGSKDYTLINIDE